MSLLEGTFAAVTGGARGLGAGIARRLAAEGARGAVLDLPSDRSHEVPEGWEAIPGGRARRGIGTRGVRPDIDRVDVLVAAAGIVPALGGHRRDRPGRLGRGVRRQRPRDRRRRSSTPRRCSARAASVVLIGSLNSWRGDPNIASYVASKHAVLGITRSAALDLGRRGIRVNALGPGPVATEALLARMATRERELGFPSPPRSSVQRRRRRSAGS